MTFGTETNVTRLQSRHGGQSAYIRGLADSDAHDRQKHRQTPTTIIPSSLAKWRRWPISCCIWITTIIRITSVNRKANIFSITNPLQSFHVLHKEPICVVPRQKNIFDNVTNAFLLKTEIVGTDHRRIHQVQSTTRIENAGGKLYKVHFKQPANSLSAATRTQPHNTHTSAVSKNYNKTGTKLAGRTVKIPLQFSPDCICSIFAHNVHWVGVVLLTFTHLLSITAAPQHCTFQQQLKQILTKHTSTVNCFTLH